MRRMKSLTLAVGLVLATLLSGCGDPDPERYIIVDKDPFYKKELPYREGSEDEIISTVKEFAGEHGMDYLSGPSHPTLSPGEFNLHTVNKTFNLAVARILIGSPNVQVSAFATDKPTQQDHALTVELVCRLEKTCENTLPPTKTPN